MAVKLKNTLAPLWPVVASGVREKLVQGWGIEDGQMDGQTDGWPKRQMEGRMDSQLNRYADGHADGRVVG